MVSLCSPAACPDVPGSSDQRDGPRRAGAGSRGGVSRTGCGAEPRRRPPCPARSCGGPGQACGGSARCGSEPALDRRDGSSRRPRASQAGAAELFAVRRTWSRSLSRTRTAYSAMLRAMPSPRAAASRRLDGCVSRNPASELSAPSSCGLRTGCWGAWVLTVSGNVLSVSYSPQVRRRAAAQSRRTASSPHRRLRSPGWLTRGPQTPRSALSSSSVRARWSTTCTKSSANWTSALGASSTACSSASRGCSLLLPVR